MSSDDIFECYPDWVLPRLCIAFDARMAGTGKGVTARQRRFGDNVRAARQSAGLTQDAVAHASGLARAYVGALEAGHRNPSLETICRLALALEVDAAELAQGCQSETGRIPGH